MTQQEAVLTALAKATADRVSFEDVVVIAYRAYPELFCMRGHPQYPCSKKVGGLLFGHNNLLERKLLRKIDNRYILTEAGYNAAGLVR